MLARSASLQNCSQIKVNIKYPVRIDVPDLNQCLQIYMNESLSPVENWKVGRAKDTYRGASREIDGAAAKVRSLCYFFFPMLSCVSVKIETLSEPLKKVHWINPAANISFPPITPETAGFKPMAIVVSLCKSILTNIYLSILSPLCHS